MMGPYVNVPRIVLIGLVIVLVWAWSPVLVSAFRRWREKRNT